MLIDRDRAAAIGHETLRILEEGAYRTASGTQVDIADRLRLSVLNSQTYPPGYSLPLIRPGETPTCVEVQNETTLEAARRLFEAGSRPVALNFGSATNPGGGFLSGARAQEESLVRSSGLYACLAGNEMYAFHRGQRDPMYTDFAIYSPEVTVFRTDDGTLLEQPFACSFITCPAVNAKVVLQRDATSPRAIREAMQRRIGKVLRIAAGHGHGAVVLGAWGCGAFGNESEDVADLFQHAVSGGFLGVFSRIVFAITDWSEDSRFIGPFRRAIDVA
jgi:uncharacterized protein (TIGR02452 family)